jgi:hypothetical protein
MFNIASPPNRELSFVMGRIIIALCLFTSQAYAHLADDWRHDYMAYLSVEADTSPIRNFSSSHKSRKTSSVGINMVYFKEVLAQLSGETAVEINEQRAMITERKSEINLNRTRNLLKQEFYKHGFETDNHVFGGGVNFIAEKKGTVHPERTLILSAHIDSVGNKGANDNGTGVAGLLALAQILSGSQFPITIRMIGFDKEEVGLRGSDAYVSSLRDRDQIIGNINFEMMGVNARKDGAFHVIDCGRTESLFLSAAIRKSIIQRQLDLSIVRACTNRSDHASFWRRNIPAIVISENFFGGDADPCYHNRCDVMDDRLNYPYMAQILEAILGAIEEIAAN